ncbi:sce7725 family protein [Rhodococcus cerastii]|nr:sce7725 family protein [Rhodococcus cerastii]
MKEMIQDGTLKKCIHPVFEPIKDIHGGLFRVLHEFNQSAVDCTVIVNPQVGQLSDSLTETAQIVKFLSDREDGVGAVSIGLIVTPSTDVKAILRIIQDRDGPSLPINIFHNGHNDTLIPTLNQSSIIDRISNFVDSKDVLRQYRTQVYKYPEITQTWHSTGTIKWRDPFPRQKRNIDYVSEPASLFSDDNIYYKEDGFQGFSDYQTIGRYYAEGGGLPRAVVLHLTYQVMNNGPIYISHFSSDSNLDSSDTAGKFAEAVHKLLTFAQENRLSNPAIAKLKTYSDNGSFPGLGVLKKISIQNHIYVIQDAMDAI